MSAADIIRGTTPTVTCTTEKIDFTAFRCYLAGGRGMCQGRLSAAYFVAEDEQMDKRTDGGTSVIACTLTQTQTLAMAPGRDVLQLRAVDADGTAVATYAVAVTVADVTQKGEVSYD